MTLGTLAEQSVEVRLERTAGLELGVLACLLMTSHGTDLCPRSQCDSRSPSLGAVPSDITLSPQDCLCLWLSRPVSLSLFKKSSSLPIFNAEDFTVRLWPRLPAWVDITGWSSWRKHPRQLAQTLIAL